MAKIIVQNTDITVLGVEGQDYISLTDMASAKDGDSRAADVIKNWIRTRYTIEFLGTWEIIHNPNFKVVEFDHFRMSAGLPSFVLSASEWVEKTNAIGIIVKKVAMVAHMPTRILLLNSVLLTSPNKQHDKICYIYEIHRFVIVSTNYSIFAAVIKRFGYVTTE